MAAPSAQPADAPVGTDSSFLPASPSRGPRLSRPPPIRPRWVSSWRRSLPTVEIDAHGDNSASNPLNPDPSKTVRWGPQSWDEMLVGFFGMIVDRHTDPEKLISRPSPPASAQAVANPVQ